MLDQETINQQLTLLAAHRRTLAQQLTQQAQFSAGHIPAHIANGIAEARANIAHIKAYLRENGVSVEDEPNDDAPSAISPNTTETAYKLETDRAQDAALQAYLDQMTELLLHEKLPLRISQPDDEVRGLARARTLTALRVLDGTRKATILQFLYEAGLIGGIKQEEGSVSRTADTIVRIDTIVSLRGANLEEADLAGADLLGADLEEVNLKGAHLNGADLQETHLFRANLHGAYLEKAYLNWAFLEEAKLAGAHLEGAHLREADLFEAHLEGAHLERADLKGASLKAAHLEEAHLEEADLSEANLEFADLEKTHLFRAKLHKAHLSEANLCKADLTNCQVTREELAQAKSLEGATLPFDMTPPPAPKVEVATQKDQATTKEPK